jgi:hypothetical protein
MYKGMSCRLNRLFHSVLSCSVINALILCAKQFVDLAIINSLA